MKIISKNKLKQFVIIPAIGFAWGDKGIHFYLAWLRFKAGIVL